MRRLVCETRFSLDQLIMPYFVCEGERRREAIEAMPGQFHFSVDTLLEEIAELEQSGVNSVLLFGLPETKDEKAKGAFDENGIVPEAVRRIKARFPDVLVITDVCLCGYTTHGHCGLLTPSGTIDNDASLPVLAKTALAHARAGADIVAPSDMMDGRVLAIREMLDDKGFEETAVMSYSVKYASAFYGPFREAAHSAPASGDRRSYQMDPANTEEALREIRQDAAEGADFVMVKPALSYLDVIRSVRENTGLPVIAYNVSGEYAMVKAAAEKGLIDERNVVLEILTSMVRAGARAVITYHARQVAAWEKESQSITSQRLISF